ncbi:hypothetical protein BDV12DRAFT_158788 [Aspergillus spectabilis]
MSFTRIHESGHDSFMMCRTFFSCRALAFLPAPLFRTLTTILPDFALYPSDSFQFLSIFYTIIFHILCFDSKIVFL